MNIKLISLMIVGLLFLIQQQSLLVMANDPPTDLCLATGDGLFHPICIDLLTENKAKTKVGKACFRKNNDDHTRQDVVITIDDGYDLSAATVWVGRNINQSPRTRNGVPLYDQYPLVCNISRNGGGRGGGSGNNNAQSNTCSVTFSIPSIFNPSRPCNNQFDAAVHVNVGQNIVMYSAWADGKKIPAKSGKPANTATYHTFQVLCDYNCR